MNERTQAGLLSPRTLTAMKPGQWAADPAARGVGVLQVRKLTNGDLSFYYRYTGPDGERVRLPIGIGLALRDARRLASDLSSRYQSGDRDLRGALSAETRERERQHKAAAVAAEVEAVRQQATLGALLTAYVSQLERDGKQSARSVGQALTRHVKDPWPALWRQAVHEITTDDLLGVIALVVDAGKLREAAKLRSYLSAAFASAIRARQDARALEALRTLKVTHNPARDLVTIEGASRARHRVLSLAELRAYWQRIRKLPATDGALLQVHLLTGAQRIEQLGRLTRSDEDPDAHVVCLWDGKGRRKAPRAHYVPLLPEAQAALQVLRGDAGPFLVSLSAGRSGATYSQFDGRLQAVVEAMEAADELTEGRFTLGDLRRTVETRLAAVKVSREIRGHLQSHGLGGVQSRHYDRYEYLDEKRETLHALLALLNGKPSKSGKTQR